MLNKLKQFYTLTLIIILSIFLFTPKAYATETDKPLFVTISTEWCYACKLLKPKIDELKSEYADRVTFIELDPTSEDSLAQSIKIANEYGITQFFNNNRNAFPTVGILCSSTAIPDKIIVGANQKLVYKEALDNLFNTHDGICGLNIGRPQIAVTGTDRPNEPKIAEVKSDRPEEHSFVDRPKEFIAEGRPKELSFWTAGQPIPAYAYYQYLVLPTCSASNNILCGNGITKIASKSTEEDAPTFKPFDPNYTRDEKGLKLKPKKGKESDE